MCCISVCLKAGCACTSDARGGGRGRGKKGGGRSKGREGGEGRDIRDDGIEGQRPLEGFKIRNLP